MGLWTLAIAVATIISWQSSNPHVRQLGAEFGNESQWQWNDIKY